MLLNLRQHAKSLNAWLHHREYLPDKHANLLRPYIFNMWGKVHFRREQVPWCELSASREICLLLFAVFPLATLMFVMWRLADLQDQTLSVFHLVWVVCDVVLVTYFWSRIAGSYQPSFKASAWCLIGLALVLLLVRSYGFYYVIKSPNSLKPFLEHQYASFVVPRLDVSGLTLNKLDKSRSTASYDYSDLYDEKMEKFVLKNNATRFEQCSIEQVYERIDLSERSFNLINMTDATICNVDFTRSKLKSANFSKAIFSGRFDVADLTAATMHHTKLQRFTRFIGADLSGADIMLAIANQVDFTVAKMRKVNVVSSELIGAFFLQTDVVGGLFSSSSLALAEFVGADLNEVKFLSTQLVGNDFRLTIGLDKQLFENGYIQYCLLDRKAVYESFGWIEYAFYVIGEESNLGAIWLQANCKLLYVPAEDRSKVITDIEGFEFKRPFDDSLDYSSSKLALRLIKANRLAGLKSLDLSGLGLSQLPKELFSLQHLRALALAANELNDQENLNQLFLHLPLLNVLDLSYNSFTRIPESIGQLQELTSLDLSRSEITKLPESIGQLRGLMLLNLQGTEITKLPESIGQLQGLRLLNLSRTGIEELPESIGQLQGLRLLNLSGTGIEELPESIGQLQGLSFLDLSENYLDSLPSSLLNLKSIKTICISNNLLQEVPENLIEMKDKFSFDGKCVYIGIISSINSDRSIATNPTRY